MSKTKTLALRRSSQSTPDAGGGVRELTEQEHLAVQQALIDSGETVEALSNPAAEAQDCEVCGGDCSSANPPVIYCPVNERKRRKIAASCLHN
jgi:hypothetical protein